MKNKKSLHTCSWPEESLSCLLDSYIKMIAASVKNFKMQNYRNLKSMWSINSKLHKHKINFFVMNQIQSESVHYFILSVSSWFPLSSFKRPWEAIENIKIKKYRQTFSVASLPLLLLTPKSEQFLQRFHTGMDRARILEALHWILKIEIETWKWKLGWVGSGWYDEFKILNPSIKIWISIHDLNPFSPRNIE